MSTVVVTPGDPIVPDEKWAEVILPPVPQGSLAWDSYLDKAEGNDRRVQRFREGQWLVIQRNLRVNRNLVLDAEPHWTTPGSCMYWQVNVTLKGGLARRQDRSERGRKILKEYDQRWVPVGPLPAGDADTIWHYIVQRGFRLRPPGYKEAASAATLDIPAVAEAPPAIYFCAGHTNGRHGFRTWRLYLEHCEYHNEEPQNIPPEVMERGREYSYYCRFHDVGFRAVRPARQHVSFYKMRYRLRKHPSVEEMEVQELAG